MSDLDVNAVLTAALTKHWANSSGVPFIGTGHVLQWDTSKVQLKLVTVDYDSFATRLLKTPLVIREDTYDNDGNTTIQHDFFYSQETNDTYTWHITGGVKVTAGVTAKVGLPIVGEGEASASIELSVEAGSETSKSVTVSWSDTVGITIPPYTDVDVQAVLSTGKATGVPFRATLSAYGQVGAYLKFGDDPAIMYWDWADLDGSFQNAHGQPPLTDAERQVVATGTCDASVGFHVGIKTTPRTKAGTTPGEPVGVHLSHA